VAAVIALMKEKFPTARVKQIAQALADSAKPTNGTAAGKWDNVGGYGSIELTTRSFICQKKLMTYSLAGFQAVPARRPCDTNSLMGIAVKAL